MIARLLSLLFPLRPEPSLFARCMAIHMRDATWK